MKMPDCICDVKALKRTPDQNKQIVIQAEECIKSAVYNLKNGTPTKNGLSFWCHIAGLLGQRLWFYRKTQAYSDKIQINANTCIRCGKCTLVCPMNNFKILKELIKRFQGVRAVLYFAEIIGMGVADGISVVLVSRIIGIITDTAVSKGNLRDTQLVKYIILTIIFKIIIQTLLAVLYNDEAKQTGSNSTLPEDAEARCSW